MNNYYWKSHNSSVYNDLWFYEQSENLIIPYGTLLEMTNQWELEIWADGRIIYPTVYWPKPL